MNKKTDKSVNISEHLVKKTLQEIKKNFNINTDNLSKSEIQDLSRLKKDEMLEALAMHEFDEKLTEIINDFQDRFGGEATSLICVSVIAKTYRQILDIYGKVIGDPEYLSQVFDLAFSMEVDDDE